ncbi:hypothetical protein PDJAM_G00226290 [Pangasius djambal]|uniref:Uncharacterized protein n=1 Tax=Pangasius djambal TaxID=1691987 RepID=A0ACC5YDG0_9TELE|nr:hypothetical protein [Pangasius djambal]
MFCKEVCQVFRNAAQVYIQFSIPVCFLQEWDAGIAATLEGRVSLLASPQHSYRDLTIRSPSNHKANTDPHYLSSHTFPELHHTQPDTSHTRPRKLEAEGVTMERRRQAVMEQVMVDQLSRAVISDPEQNSANSVNISARHKRTLHHTMVKTPKSLTEKLLSYKLCFHARILSRCGREACRELTGFYFTCDQTLTVYEYRSFGKNRLKGRAIRTLIGLGRRLRSLDVKQNGIVGKEQLRECLMEELSLSQQEVEAVWRVVGLQREFMADYAETMCAVTGDMNESRKAVFIKVYIKLDPNKTGSVSLTDIEKFYCVNQQHTEHGAALDFLTCVRDAGRVTKHVSYAEFQDYYEGLSIEIPNDQVYINILRSTWNI